MKRPVSLTVNGRSLQAMVEPRMHLTDFLRDALRLTGTHIGCEHGVCGACTVLVDGAPIRSCIAYAVACDGADVRTIEGFGGDPLMQALRDAFSRHHALQCGYCTPGMLITAHDIVRRLPDADEARVREELSGNLCRCTGYVGIVAAVKAVLDEARTTEGAAFSPSGTVPGADANVAEAATEGAAFIRSGAPTGFGSERSLRTPRVASPDSTPLPAEPPPPIPDRHRRAAPMGPESTHEIMLAVTPDALWPVLQDIPTVVRCLPGASLTGPADRDPLSIEMLVALGPMRARFEATARVVLDARRRTGVIEGSGHDRRTRSGSEGRLEFSVEPSEPGGSVLRVSMRYRLAGPLAQFGRGAVVDSIVEQLLGRFADNVATVASGREVTESPPAAGFGLVVAAFRRWLRKWFPGGGH